MSTTLINQSGRIYTTTEETMIIRLWEQGRTGFQIAKELKTTRSAILGKISRMRRAGIVFNREYNPTKDRTRQKAAPKERKERMIRIPTLPKPPAPPKLPIPIPVARGNVPPIPFAKINSQTCKYVVSGDRPADFLFCGDTVYKRCFCGYHFKISYTPRIKNENKTAKPDNTSSHAAR